MEFPQQRLRFSLVFYDGTGVQALSWLLAVPGASHTVLDARVPYAPAAMAELLGGVPASYASPATAAAMARAAYRQAAHLAALGEPLVGLGCTCALATDRPKQGRHTAWPQDPLVPFWIWMRMVGDSLDVGMQANLAVLKSQCAVPCKLPELHQSRTCANSMHMQVRPAQGSAMGSLALPMLQGAGSHEVGGHAEA